MQKVNYNILYYIILLWFILKTVDGWMGGPSCQVPIRQPGQLGERGGEEGEAEPATKHANIQGGGGGGGQIQSHVGTTRRQGMLCSRRGMGGTPRPTNQICSFVFLSSIFVKGTHFFFRFPFLQIMCLQIGQR